MKNIPSQYPDNNAKPTLQPFFSIIITTYNRAQILKKALDSLILQSEHDWEAIIVDDESSDDTYLQVIPYIRSYHKIKYLRKAHSGEALSKNAGINSSSGKFISFLDSDDEYNPIHLQSRKAILLQDTAIRFLYGGAKIIGNKYVPDRYDYNKRINLNECVIGGTFFIERSVLFQLKGFRKIMVGADADLFDRAAGAGVLMKETKLPTYIYHHENKDSITNMLIKSNSESEEVYTDINMK
jgi:Glycosyltransferases involved in cell wall biogenesis